MQRLSSSVILCLVIVIVSSARTSAELPKGPLSPEESLKHFVLADPNLQIEIVAAEPEVIDPVSMQFDEHGRLWVVEMRDYPTGPRNAPPPLGGPDAKPLSRIKLLEDKDGDGRFETAHTFAENLLFATGVQPWDGGVIVTLEGEVAYFKDTDGDHKADVRETWFTGFAQANPQLRANHPTFGPDGWIYIANGLRGGNVIAVKKDWPVKVAGETRRQADKETNKTEAPSSPSPRLTVSPRPAQQSLSHDPQNPVPVSLTGRDFKFDPLTGRYEAISGNGQFGLTFDAWGNRFVCDNRHPCRQVIFEEEFIRRCPHVPFPAVVHDVIPPDDKNKVFPLTSAWTTSNLHAGTFTAACGVTVYTGDWLPEDYRGNVFVCEPTGNLVQRAVLEPDGVTFKSRNPHERRSVVPQPRFPNAPTTPQNGSTPNSQSESTARSESRPWNDRATGTQEFLASRDEWFRPVDLQNGPDGALYVVDMYRAVIEHPEWVPDELKNRPDTWLGNDKGRLYRIRPRGDRKPFDPVSLTNLWHKNRWVVMTALRLRLQKQDSPHRQVDDATIARIVYGSPQVADLKTTWQHVARVAVLSPNERRDLWSSVPWQHLRNPEPRVRFEALQAVAALGDLGPTQARPDFVAEVALRDAGDSWMRQMCVAVAGDDAPALLNEVMQRCHDGELWRQPGLGELLYALGEQIGLRANEADLNCVIARLGESVRSAERRFGRAPHASPEFEIAISGMLGVATGLSRRGQPIAARKEALSAIARIALAETTRICDNVAQFHEDAPERRRLAIRWLRHADLEGDRHIGESLQALAENLSDQQLRLLALESLASFRKPEVDAWLLERYRSETPAIRRAILSALFASKERQLALLEAIANGQIAATEIDPVRAAQLTNSKDEAVREKAQQVLAAAAPASRKEVLEAYRPALALKGDPQRGREVFQKNCGTCHRVGDLGVNVAPDISDTRTKKPEQLLLDILDPNRAIDANYFSYAVTLKDGKVESGVIASESSNSITLKQPEGKVVTLLRSDIEELRNTGLSLMPVGVEKNINPQQMADLIFWLKNWRYLDGKVPATSLK